MTWLDGNRNLMGGQKQDTWSASDTLSLSMLFVQIMFTGIRPFFQAMQEQFIPMGYTEPLKNSFVQGLLVESHHRQLAAEPFKTANNTAK